MPTPVTYTLLEMCVSICAISRRKSVLTPSISWLSSFSTLPISCPNSVDLFLKRLARVVEVLGGDCPFVRACNEPGNSFSEIVGGSSVAEVFDGFERVNHMASGSV